jgi:hypothetical protein
MAKYVIAKDDTGEYYCAFRVYFGFWGMGTYVSDTVGDTPEESEQKLRKLLVYKKEKNKVVKTIEI